MSKFYYRARDRKGEITEGSIKAENAWMARKTLNKMNLVPLEVSRFNLKLMFKDLEKSFEVLQQKVTLEEQMVLMSQIETGISVGIPVIQMLQMLQQDLGNKYLKETLTQISADVTEGSSLHDAFGKHPKVFDTTVVGLIKTGEVSGKLDETLSRITQMLEQQSDNKTKVKSATFYPKIVLFFMVVVLGIVVYFVIPKLKAFLKAYGSDLPPITQFVVNVSDFFIHYWYLVFGMAWGGKFALTKALATPKGKSIFDRYILKTPILGNIFLFLELNHFCIILELLISSGVPLLDALETLRGSQKNQTFKDALTHCEEEIRKGSTLIKGMEGSTVFPNTFRNLIGMGEETGRLPPVLKRLGRYYQIQVDYLLDNLSKAIEPVLLSFIFVVVLVLALAVFLPIWKMNSVIHK